MTSSAYKFANEVLPLMLAEQAAQRDPVAPRQPPAPAPAPLPFPKPAESKIPAVKTASFEAQLVQLALEKDAGLGGVLRGIGSLGRGVGNFGRGMWAVTKPFTGLLRGGLPGAGRGIMDAGRSIAAGGAPAVLGAGTGAYLGYSSLRSPIVAQGDSIRFQSPIRIPDGRFRSPITMRGIGTGGGIEIRNPIKTLW